MPTLRDEVFRTGLAFYKSLEPSLVTGKIAPRLGSVIRIDGVAEVQSLIPRDTDSSPPNILSGNFGTGMFPLHTDLAHWYRPPRYLLLRAVVGFASVPTRLLDGQLLVALFGAATLARTLVTPRRPVGGTRPLMQTLSKRSDGVLLRWDTLFLNPASDASTTVLRDVASYLDSSKPQEPCLVEPGDTLVIDNWRMLHGRAPIPVSAASRHIERVYLSSLT